MFIFRNSWQYHHHRAILIHYQSIKWKTTSDCSQLVGLWLRWLKLKIRHSLTATFCKMFRIKLHLHKEIFPHDWIAAGHPVDHPIHDHCCFSRQIVSYSMCVYFFVQFKWIMTYAWAEYITRQSVTKCCHQYAVCHITVHEYEILYDE